MPDATIHPARRPNVLLLMTDQQKATASELYGGPVRTPHLARIAAQGVLYERAYTPHPLCVPARVSLWTGRWPHAHGARTNETPMPRAETHLAQLLHGAGYRLGHFGKNHCFTQEDFDACFDRTFFAGHGDRFEPGVTMVRSQLAPRSGFSLATAPAGLQRALGLPAPHGAHAQRAPREVGDLPHHRGGLPVPRRAPPGGAGRAPLPVGLPARPPRAVPGPGAVRLALPP